MSYIFEGFVLFLLIFFTIALADLLIMFIRYRIETDEWRYPIDMVNFRKWLSKQDHEMHDDKHV